LFSKNILANIPKKVKSDSHQKTNYRG